MQGFKVPPWQKIHCSCSSVIYNLEVFTYNQTKPFIEILTRSPIIFSVISQLCTASINRNARDWV